jgi:hypothetical protein
MRKSRPKVITGMSGLAMTVRENGLGMNNWRRWGGGRSAWHPFCLPWAWARCRKAASGRPPHVLPTPPSGAERRLPTGAATAHLPQAGSPCGCEPGNSGCGAERRAGAGDAPWGGREAPARSAPLRHPAYGPAGTGSLCEPSPVAHLPRPLRGRRAWPRCRGTVIRREAHSWRAPHGPSHRTSMACRWLLRRRTMQKTRTGKSLGTWMSNRRAGYGAPSTA